MYAFGIQDYIELWSRNNSPVTVHLRKAEIPACRRYTETDERLVEQNRSSNIAGILNDPEIFRLMIHRH